MTIEDQQVEVPQALKLYTVAETAAILSVSKKSVYNWIKQAALPAIRLGPGQRYLRIRQTDLERFISAQDFQGV
jgi:excisionase family DNA binding protein